MAKKNNSVISLFQRVTVTIKLCQA